MTKTKEYIHGEHNSIVRFGQVIKEERLRLGLSQDDLADRAGVHRTYIGMVERGEKNVTLKNIVKFATSLGLTLKELFAKY